METPIPIPRLNANDDEVEVVHWHVPEGTFVKEGTDVADVASSKAVFTIQASGSGFLKLCLSLGTMAKVGSPIAFLIENKETTPKGVEQCPPANILADSPAGFARFSNDAKKLLEAERIDPSLFDGLGLVTSQTIRRMKFPKKVETAHKANSPSLRSEKVGAPKRAEIEALSKGQKGQLISSLTVSLDADRILKSLRKYSAFQGQPLPVILYELSKLLSVTPGLTAYYEEGRIFYYDAVRLGVAIDLGKGLKVVTIRDADRLLPIQFAEKMTDAARRYLENTLGMDDLTGSTFTVTDLTGQGIHHFQPLLNEYQSGILGVGGDLKSSRPFITFSLAFDHRVLSGREVGQFLVALKNGLEGYQFESA